MVSRPNGYRHKVTSNNLVLLERRADGVAVITLNNPKVNALSQAVLAELRDIAHDLTNNRPGAVVVTGGERILRLAPTSLNLADPVKRAALAKAFTMR